MNHKLPKFHSLYRVLFVEESDLCYYCGEPRWCYDHCPPLSIVDEETKFIYDDFYLVPSCRQCNSLLGSCGAGIPWQRRMILKHRLYKCYCNRRGKQYADEEIQSLIDEALIKEEDIFGLGHLAYKRLIYQGE